MTGRFKPGQSGNPRGRPRKRPTLQEQAAELAPEALSLLAEILELGQDPRARAIAAAAIVALAKKEHEK